HLAGALQGADPELPVLLLAHQPAFVDRAAAGGVDLQLSGHTHGGQIWPFHHLVRLDQPALAGLSRHGARTLLYTSRGTGFWGPPFRVFAPSEITLLVLRSPHPPASS
ncbi:metallophosphoesterase, partial [Streptomyces fradiae]